MLPCELVRRGRQCKHFVNVTFPLRTEEKVTFYPWNGRDTTHTARRRLAAPSPNTHKTIVVLSWSDMNSSPFQSIVFLAFVLHSSRMMGNKGEREMQDVKGKTRTSCHRHVIRLFWVKSALCPSLRALITNFNHTKRSECSPAVVNLLLEMPVCVSCLPGRFFSLYLTR